MKIHDKFGISRFRTSSGKELPLGVNNFHVQRRQLPIYFFLNLEFKTRVTIANIPVFSF